MTGTEEGKVKLGSKWEAHGDDYFDEEADRRALELARIETWGLAGPGAAEREPHEEYFSCSLCDGWFAPPGMILSAVWKHAVGVKGETFAQHNARVHDREAILVKKTRPIAE